MAVSCPSLLKHAGPLNPEVSVLAARFPHRAGWCKSEGADTWSCQTGSIWL